MSLVQLSIRKDAETELGEKTEREMESEKWIECTEQRKENYNKRGNKEREREIKRLFYTPRSMLLFILIRRLPVVCVLTKQTKLYQTFYSLHMMINN